MNQTKSLYHGYRFPSEIISHAIGCIIDFASAFVILKIYWLNVELLFPTKLSTADEAIIIIIQHGGTGNRPGVSAHPENSPLTFVPHKTKDGRIIYTNFPKRCFRDGVPIYIALHPIYGGRMKV